MRTDSRPGSRKAWWHPGRHSGLALVTLFLGILVSVSHYGQIWEEDLGLGWLFALRGPIDPPPDPLIVSIDRASADHFSLPNDPSKWPRDLHGRLVDHLAQAGASLVAFDVIFQEPRDPDADRAFAAAMQRAGNVILFEYLHKERPDRDALAADGTPEYVIVQKLPPLPLLGEAAVACAPFALPKIRAKVSRVWLFKPDAGDVPTLPMVALHVYTRAAHTRLHSLIAEVDPQAYSRLAGILEGENADVAREIRVLRGLFASDPAFAPRLLARLDQQEEARVQRRRNVKAVKASGLLRQSCTPRRVSAREQSSEWSENFCSRALAGDLDSYEQLRALVSAYQGHNSLYLNFYGPALSIETISYHRLLLDTADDRIDLRGRAVFVGAAARWQSEQKDGFYTTYTQDTGLDVSGVEIAATTFANLLAGHSVRPLAPIWWLLLLAGWGSGLVLVLRWVPGGWIPAVALTIGSAYLGGAYLAFVHLHLWMPLVVPLLVQLPLATFGGILWRFRDIQRERENIRRAFGMHLSNSAVDQLARGIDDFTATTEQAFGICLATDAEQYTTLAERLDPARLRTLMNDYYGAIFPAVKRGGGVVSDVIGDSMLAIWASGDTGTQVRRRACTAALDVLNAVDAFNARQRDYRLPTRLGLHCGELVLGYVGAVDHYEYRAMGDIVNTATRIEGLGKLLGVRLLVSADVAADLGDFTLRELGRFLLKGKSFPLTIYELMGGENRASDAPAGMRIAFAEALAAFTAGHWEQALDCFEGIERRYGEDGPSRFYSRLCRSYLANPAAADTSGVVKIESLRI